MLKRDEYLLYVIYMNNKSVWMKWNDPVLREGLIYNIICFFLLFKCIGENLLPKRPALMCIYFLLFSSVVLGQLTERFIYLRDLKKKIYKKQTHILRNNTSDCMLWKRSTLHRVRSQNISVTIWHLRSQHRTEKKIFFDFNYKIGMNENFLN